MIPTTNLRYALILILLFPVIGPGMRTPTSLHKQLQQASPCKETFSPAFSTS